MFFRIKKIKGRRYLQLVRTFRDERGKVQQQVQNSFGNYDKIVASGDLEKIYSNIGKLLNIFDPRNMVNDDDVSVKYCKIGPGVVFQRLWEEAGLPEIFEELTRERKFEFSMDRAVFLSMMHRLFFGGSDRNAVEWRLDYDIPGTCEIELQHLYRAMSFLGENKNRIEELLFHRNRDLFNQSLDLVFFDTTSIYFESDNESNLKKHGFPKRHRSGLLQVVFGVLLDGEGKPIASEVLPGNTADVTTVQPLINRLRERFHLRRVIFVGDRGFTSNSNLQAFEDIGFEFVVGVKMRSVRECREVVLPQAFDFEYVADNLFVAEVRAEDRRYIVCYNPDQALRDARNRQQICDALETALQQGSKRLIGNRGYRKFLRVERHSVTIDGQKLESEAIYDGLWVLRTNTNLPAANVALQYKRLWQVEQFFRDTKSTLFTRPIFHQNDGSIAGHIFVSFLALLLRHNLYQRLAEKNHFFEWASIVSSLERLAYIPIRQPDKSSHWRTDADRTCVDIFKSVGVAIPKRYLELSTQ